MHSFRDTKNREWKIDINCDVIESVLAETNTNLLDLLDKDSQLLMELTTFPPLVCKLVAATIREQLVEAKIDDKEFRRAMNGDALSEASDALLDELVLFSPKHSRNLRAAVLEKHREVQAAATDLAMGRIEDPALKERLIAAMDRRIERDLREALAHMEGHEPPARSSAPESSTTVGTPPDSSDSPVLDLSHGESSAGSPTEDLLLSPSSP
jgi:hypothetical protein